MAGLAGGGGAGRVRSANWRPHLPAAATPQPRKASPGKTQTLVILYLFARRPTRVYCTRQEATEEARSLLQYYFFCHPPTQTQALPFARWGAGPAPASVRAMAPRQQQWPSLPPLGAAVPLGLLLVALLVTITPPSRASLGGPPVPHQEPPPPSLSDEGRNWLCFEGCATWWGDVLLRSMGEGQLGLSNTTEQVAGLLEDLMQMCCTKMGAAGQVREGQGRGERGPQGSGVLH